MRQNQDVMVITGTSKGLGKAIAEYYLARNFIVCGCSRGASTIVGENYDHNTLDVGDNKQVCQWIKKIKLKHQKIDVLICNAGNAVANLLMMMTPITTFTDILQTNIAGTYYVSCEVAKVMMKQKQGRIITFSSMAVGLHEEGTSAYSASKSAIVEMTKILAKELAPLGITCNVIAPSIYMTSAVNDLGREIIDKALNKLTIKKILSIDEICNIISFYMAPESCVVTGQVIYCGLVC
jgi:3-oxoacyl-[acyl-carrier protein] reductase